MPGLENRGILFTQLFTYLARHPHGIQQALDNGELGNVYRFSGPEGPAGGPAVTESSLRSLQPGDSCPVTPGPLRVVTFAESPSALAMYPHNIAVAFFRLAR